MRCLVYSDGPCVNTGFGVVARNIFGPLKERGLFSDLNFWGVNYRGTPHDSGFKIWPAQNPHDPDPYGRQQFMQQVLIGPDHGLPLFDILFVVQDHFTVSQTREGEHFLPSLITQAREQVTQGRPPFAVIYYIPVDATTLKPEWIAWIPQVIDFPVAYMHWSKHVLVDMMPQLRDMPVIYHGTDPKTFHPLPDEEVKQFRRNILQVRDDQPLVIFVNRNQARKDPARALQIFARVREEVPEAVFYMHTEFNDAAGNNLRAVQTQLRLPAGAVRFPEGFQAGRGVSEQDLNRIYNAGDVFLATSTGEGFGLSVSECMSAGGCVVAPNHTAFTELLADDRGILGAIEDDWYVVPLDNDIFRPRAAIGDMAQCVVEALREPKRRKEIGKRARWWAQKHQWKKQIANQWEDLFKQAYASLPREEVKRDLSLSSALKKGDVE